MNVYFRIAAFLTIFLGSFVLPLPFFLVCAFVHMLFWSGYELLIIGVVIDSVYGTSATSFLYTISLGILLLVYAGIRPYVSWYNTNI
jgi:small-conductance mechanosensitive channel